jgi:hypothetical protein
MAQLLQSTPRVGGGSTFYVGGYVSTDCIPGVVRAIRLGDVPCRSTWLEHEAPPKWRFITETDLLLVCHLRYLVAHCRGPLFVFYFY